MNNDFLPFDRGKTASYGIKVAPPAGVAGDEITTLPSSYGCFADATNGNKYAYRPDLAGWESRIKSHLGFGDARQGEFLTLRAVQAAYSFTIPGTAGVAYATNVSLNKLVQFSVLADQWGIVTPSANVFGSSASVTLASAALDHAYILLNPGGTINQYDWFWVITEGPARLYATNSPISVGTAVCNDGNGLVKTTVATAAIVGTCMTPSISGSAACQVHMRHIRNQCGN